MGEKPKKPCAHANGQDRKLVRPTRSRLQKSYILQTFSKWNVAFTTSNTVYPFPQISSQ